MNYKSRQKVIPKEFFKPIIDSYQVEFRRLTTQLHPRSRRTSRTAQIKKITPKRTKESEIL